MHREPEVLETEAQVEKWLDCRARITSKQIAPLHSVKSGILQNACSTSPKMDADLVKSALVHTARLMKSLAIGLSRMVAKNAVAMLKITRQLGYIFQDMEPPKSSSILRKSSNWLKPIRCVRYTKAVLRHANIREQNHRLEWFAQVITNSATPMLQNLRSGLKKRRNGKSDVPVEQRGGWPQIS